MKKCNIVLLFVLALLLSSCFTNTSSNRTLDLHTVSSWQHEESIIRPAVAATINSKDYLFFGTQPNSSDDDNLLIVLDITNPSSPIEVASLVAPENYPIYGIVMHDTTLYARLMRSFWIVDVSDPTMPKQLSVLTTGSNPSNVAFSDNYLYIDLSEYSAENPKRSIQVVGVSDPSNPQLAATVAVAPEAIIREASGNRLYCTGADGFRIIDISSPLEPREIGFYADPTGIEGHSTTGSGWDTMDGFADVAVVGNYAFIASALSGLRVLDITNPSNIKEVTKLDTEVIILSISIYGNFAFMYAVNREPFHFEMLAIDVTDPIDPKILDSIEISVFTFDRPVQLGDYIYITGGSSLGIIGLYEE